MSEDKFIVPSSSPVVPGKFDTRVLNKSLKNGTLTSDQIAEHLKQLPDESDWAEHRDYNEVVGDEEASFEEAPSESLASEGIGSHVPSESISDGGYGAAAPAKQEFGAVEGSTIIPPVTGPLYGDGGVAHESSDRQNPQEEGSAVADEASGLTSPSSAPAGDAQGTDDEHGGEGFGH